MNRWIGKLALVTGASSGIGKEIVRDLSKNGVNVVAVARRYDRLKELAAALSKEKGKVYPLQVDLSNDEDIISAFKWIDSNLKVPVQILVNCAGILLLTNTADGEIDQWRKIFEINVFAAGKLTRETLTLMKKYDTTEGHIINMSSLVAHRVVHVNGTYVYSASKHAMKVISEGFVRECFGDVADSKLRVTSLSPGLVSTELFYSASETNQAIREILKESPALAPEMVSDAVIYALSTPQNGRIHDLIIQAPKEIF